MVAAIPSLGSRTLLVYLFERAIACLICEQFSTVHLNFKLSTYIQETVGDRLEGLHTGSFKREEQLAAKNGVG
jgi:hypothetical protein